MAAYPPSQPPFGNDWRTQRRVLREQARMQRDAYRAQFRGMRRYSVVGPLLLIAIGVLVLLAQIGRLPWPDLLNRFAHWWPLLLVVVGVVRLIEWIFDQRAHPDAPPGTPYPRRSLGPAVVLLLVLIAVCGLVASGLHGRGGRNIFAKDGLWNQDEFDEFLGDKHESDQSLTLALAAGAEMSIDNPRGDVVVHGTSSDGQLHLSLHKEVFTQSDSDADRKAHELTPQIRTEDTRVMVGMPSIDGARTQLTVSLPAATPLVVNANRGEVRLNAMAAPLTVTANHGDVDLEQVSGPVSVHINNSDSSLTVRNIYGPLDVTGHAKDLTLSDVTGPVSMAGEFFGTTHLAHIRSPVGFHTSRTDLHLVRLDGELEISSTADLSADEVVGPMVLNTRNRNINLDRVSGDLAITNRNGAIDLVSAPPLGSVSIENRNGSVNVTLPGSASFSVQADTMNGELENEFSFPIAGAENHPSLSGTVGQGGPVVRITTSQGDISLKRGSASPLPPLPPLPPVPAPSKDTGEVMREAARAREEALHATQEAARAARRAAEEARKAAKDASPN